MPTVLNLLGMKFYYWALEHEPVHIHVKKGNAQAKFALEPKMKLISNSGLKPQELALQKILSKRIGCICWNIGTPFLEKTIQKTNKMKNKKVSELWFDDNRLFVKMLNGDVVSQPLRFFYHLQNATNSQRQRWQESSLGLHWNEIDEDISFESLYWNENDTNTFVYSPSIKI
jgi:hypothetical protein